MCQMKVINSILSLLRHLCCCFHVSITYQDWNAEFKASWFYGMFGKLEEVCAAFATVLNGSNAGELSLSI